VCLVDFVLQSGVLILFFIVSGYGFKLDAIWLYPFAFVALLLITVAFTLLVSALNVRYRDVQHLIGLALLVWFWMTPIVYGAGTVYTSMVGSRVGITGWRIYLLNPVTWVVIGFQRALYHTPEGLKYLAPYSAGQLAIGLSAVCVVAAIAVYLSWRLFFSMSGDFAEEL